MKNLELTSTGGATMKRLEPDGSFLATGKSPSKDTYRVRFKLTAAKNITGIMIEALPHDSLTAKSLARSVNGNFVLSGISSQAGESRFGHGQLRAERAGR